MGLSSNCRFLLAGLVCIPVSAIVREVRRNPLYWLLVFVPVVLAVEAARPEAHTALFVLSVLAIVPLAALLSRATESVAAKTGDAVGGLLNATLGNLTELVIAITALRAGMLDLVKASIAGAVVTNSLFLLGGSFLLGGLKHRVQEFNARNARVQSSMLLLASIALVVPSAVSRVDRLNVSPFMLPLSLCLAVILLVTYGLSLVFSLKTHKDLFASAGGGEHETPWPLPFALGRSGARHARHRLRERDLRGRRSGDLAEVGDVAGLRRIHRRLAGRGRRGGMAAASRRPGRIVWT